MTKCKKKNANTEYVIADTFYEHYEAEDRPINHTVIRGYIENAKLKLKLISRADMLAKQGYMP